MPLSITFDDRAVKYLVSPPKPSQPLRDIVLVVRTSNEINSLAMMGRGILRGCVIARTFKPPVSPKFDLEVDNRINDNKLASVAQRSGLVKRLNLDGVATDPIDLAHILCAYLGATFLCEWKRHGESTVHRSVDEICTMVLDDDEPGVVENNSHEKLTKIPGVERMSTPVSFKPEPASTTFSPMPTRAAHHVVPDLDMACDESVSSGRSPPPHMYGPHYHQPYQPYYPPNPSNPSFPPPSMQYIHPQTAQPQRFPLYASGSAHTPSPSFMTPQPQPGYQQPAYQAQPQSQYQTSPPPANTMGRGGYDQFSGLQSIPNNPPSYNMPAPPPAPAPLPAHVPIPPPSGQQTQGFISLFNEMAMKHRIASTWQQQKTGQQHIPEWTMWLMVDGQPRGCGTAATKQAAKEIAAKAALQSMGWLAA